MIGVYFMKDKINNLKAFVGIEPTTREIMLNPPKEPVYIEKNKNMDYSKVMAFYHPFKVRFYEYYSPRGIPDGVSAALLPVTVTLDIITAPLQFLVVYAVNQ